MTGRDRLVVMIIAAIAVLGGVWLVLVSPERKEAKQLEAQVSAAKAQLSSAESQANGAEGARERYAAAYASVVSLGKAVPAEQEVPSLMYQLAQASNQKNVDFSSIVAGAGAAGASSSASSTTPASSASTTAAGTAAAATGFSQMPFTFVFEGSFTDLYHMFNQLNGYTARTTAGGLHVSGRLLTIQSVKLAPPAGGAGATSHSALVGTISATAYVLPAGQGLTGGATASSPVGSTSTPASSTSTSSTPAASSTGAPAVIR